MTALDPPDRFEPESMTDKDGWSFTESGLIEWEDGPLAQLGIRPDQSSDRAS
jgi:hypothetical protein